MKEEYTNYHRSRHHNHIALRDGKVYIYDNSGSNPDECDDGPLWIPEDKVTEIHVRLDSDSPYGPKAKIPVRDDQEWGFNGTGNYWTEVDLEGAIKLGRRLSVPVDLVTNLYRPPV